MPREEGLLESGLIQNVVNDCREVQSTTFVPAVGPKLRTRAACVEIGVVLGEGVPSGVEHPDVVTY